MIALLRDRFGENWTADDEANLRFSIEVETLLHGVPGIHLIGDPEFDAGRLTMTCWVDEPIDDLFELDRIAFDIFGRISEQFFCAERKLEQKTIRYPFVTGSSRHGHVGALVLAGPHAADFAARQALRSCGELRYQA
jgi:hypothetical protein